MQLQFEEAQPDGSLKPVPKAYGWLLFVAYSLFCGVVGAVVAGVLS